VLFAAWGAQEPGQQGTRYYVQHPALPLEGTLAVLNLDAVGGGDGYYLEASGSPEQDGAMLFAVRVVQDLVDGRIAVRSDLAIGDQVPFRDADLSTLQLTWRGASEDNWPVELADEVEPYRLGVTGRIVGLVVMTFAR
jgi:Zn-dependent M28 family amino/carboxypeptidase